MGTSSKRRFDVRAEIEIDREPAVVRRQFADVEHHEQTGVHHGTQFVVLEESDERCHYRQTTTLGPLRLRQEFELPRTEAGPLVNTVVDGQFTGGAITFTVEPVPDDTSRSLVEARLTAELKGLERLAAPLLRRSVTRALENALEEDKHDLENGGYESRP